MEFCWRFAQDSCLLDIWDIFDSHWEAQGGDASEPEAQAPLLAIEDGPVNGVVIELDPEESGPERRPAADDGYGLVESTSATHSSEAKTSEAIPP